MKRCECVWPQTLHVAAQEHDVDLGAHESVTNGHVECCRIAMRDGGQMARHDAGSHGRRSAPEPPLLLMTVVTRPSMRPLVQASRMHCSVVPSCDANTPIRSIRVPIPSN